MFEGTNPYRGYEPVWLENEITELNCQINDYEYNGLYDLAEKAREHVRQATAAITGSLAINNLIGVEWV